MLRWGRPGLGIGQGFYAPIILVGLARGPLGGAIAGFAGLVLYLAALLIRAQLAWSDVLSMPTAVRAVSYLVAGAIVGYVATRRRHMLARSRFMFDELLVIGRRDRVTGASTSRGFETAINRRLALRVPFALFVGEPSQEQKQVLRRRRSGHDDGVRDLARLVVTQLESDDELARVGQTRFAVLASAETVGRALDRTAALERSLLAAGSSMSFGWAVYPQDGDDALSLYGTAIERLHARLIVRGDWRPTAASAGLVDELDATRTALTCNRGDDAAPNTP